MNSPKISIVICWLVMALNVNSQSPAHWSFSYKKLGEKRFVIHLTATMDKDWHIYAMKQPKEAIGQPTEIVFAKNPLVMLNGKVKEIGKKELYNNREVGIKQYQYGGAVDFVQEISLKAYAKTNISGEITYQVCTDEKCLEPTTQKFNIALR